MTFEQEIIKGVLIYLGAMISVGIIYKIFFKQPEPIIIKPVPRKVEVRRW